MNDSPGDAANGIREVTAGAGGQKHQYPSTYGQVCDDHDQGKAPFCADPCNLEMHPDWCGNKWCFVKDANNCKDAKESTYVKGLFYSYDVCNDTDTYSE